MFWLGLDNFGSTWAKLELTSVNLGHFRLYSFLREVFISDLFNFGKTWVISNNFGSNWVILGHVESTLAKSGNFGSACVQFGSPWVILGHFNPTGVNLGH